MHEHLYKCVVEEIQNTTNEVSARNEKQVRRYKQQAQNNMHMGRQIIVHIEEDGKSCVASRKSIVVAMMSS